ncbi:MAG: deoxyguanosinetriphosphate triphosphohydrolase [Actinomycetes bacterium]
MTDAGPPDERWVEEPEKRSGRTEYERDRARVLHSSALRRLAAKTQVVVPGESDFPRTRLTHSLECAQIGRGIGQVLGADPDLVETACLAHDLGHPPFGHTGEAALASVAEECGGFEGNAQSLRILTRLEAKAFSPDGRSVGLNLTRASLDASCKYPWGRDRDVRKFGVYDDDREVFDWLRAGAPDGVRCLEAQVMDWSDDVAYSVHDLEDALFAGHLTFAQLADPAEASELAALVTARCPGTSTDDVDTTLDRLVGLPWWPASYDGSHRGLATLKNLTSQLIGRFARAAEAATRESFGDGRLARYGADLVVPPGVRLECEILKAVADRYVMSSADATRRYALQTELVLELVDLVERRAPAALDPLWRDEFGAAADDAARMRVVLDQVASLTDTSALALHTRLGSG